MPSIPATFKFGTAITVIGLAASVMSAQTDRRKLERPPEYELPSLSSSTTRNTVSSRTNSKIPDPSIFDGSDFPKEERPERGLLANMERPGEEPPPVPGPGEEEGAGGGPQQGGGEEQMAGGGGQGGGGEGDGEEGAGGAPSAPSIAGLPPIAQAGGGEGGEGEEGQPGQPGSPDAPKAPAGAQGRQLQKPSAVQIGDPNASLAESQKPTASASAQLESEQGEARMQVQAAQGAQAANRGKGTERGKDIPSNL